jgi:hypothetical protein
MDITHSSICLSIHPSTQQTLSIYHVPALLQDLRFSSGQERESPQSLDTCILVGTSGRLCVLNHVCDYLLTRGESV